MRRIRKNLTIKSIITIILIQLRNLKRLFKRLLKNLMRNRRIKKEKGQMFRNKDLLNMSTINLTTNRNSNWLITNKPTALSENLIITITPRRQSIIKSPHTKKRLITKKQNTIPQVLQTNLLLLSSIIKLRFRIQNNNPSLQPQRSTPTILVKFQGFLLTASDLII